MASARERGWHVRELLGAYVLGGLAAQEASAVRAHLDRCARCQAEHEKLACVPSWLDLLAGTEAAGGLGLVADDHVPGDDGPAGAG
jgi:anti-sigma factor RsiW